MCEIVSAATMASYFGAGAGALTVTQVAAVAGTMISAYGMYQQSQGQQAQAKYQAQVNENNVVIADRNAKDAIQRGVIAEQEERRRLALLTGEMTAKFGGSGGSIDDESSQGSLLKDLAEFGELDALTIRHNAEREAYAAKVQGMNFGANAQLERAKADQEAKALPFKVGGTLLSGAATVADMNYRGSDTYRRSLIR